MRISRAISSNVNNSRASPISHMPPLLTQIFNSLWTVFWISFNLNGFRIMASTPFNVSLSKCASSRDPDTTMNGVFGDRCLIKARQLPTVHERHLKIGDHQIVRSTKKELSCFEAITSETYIVPEKGERS